MRLLALWHRSRASLIGYGSWALLSLMLAGGTLMTLVRAEQTESNAVLARAEAGAAATEQTMLRVTEAAEILRRLAQTRLRLEEAGNASAVEAIGQQLRDAVLQGRFGLRSVVLTRRGRIDWTSWPQSRPPYAVGGPAPAELAASASLTGAFTPPAFSPASGRWSASLGWVLADRGGAPAGSITIWLDPLALCTLIARQTGSSDAVSSVQLLPSGAFLAHSGEERADGERALREQPAADDPALLQARRYGNGALHDMHDGVDRLVGLRVPGDANLVIAQSFDTKRALAAFFRLRSIVLTVMAALVSGTFIATRLILANYKLRERLADQAMTDPLTGLHNRRYFAERMTRDFEAARRGGSSAAVLLIDLDGFKQINDTRGHPVGDALLRQVAARLQRCIGAEDQVMRLGGDEFAIVRLCRQQRRDSTSLARYVVSELSKPYEVEDHYLRISASVGVALYPSGGEGLDDLLRSADIALYFVKSNGGDAHRIFDPLMAETVRSRRALEMDLREAIGRGELEVFYQPLVQLDPRRVSGFEALVRWHHPVLGMVMPGRFIPIAEESGLIAPIGEWVLRQACREAVRWPPGTRVAVNLSPVQFDRSDIVDVVASALRETRLPPGLLELEITEGVMMSDMGDVLATMHCLHGLGVRLAMDDFGTGYSSLSYLRSFPFDKVKIDASFLADMKGDGGTIIRAVLGLCGHLKLDTLVEGVETEEQLNWLRTEGCKEVQGHLFSPPRGAEMVADIISSVERRRIAAPARSLARL